MPTSGHKTSRNFTALVARRIWTAADKRRLVAEMALPGANVSEISRRHAVANSLLYRWRQDLEAGRAVAAPSTVTPPVSGFIPVAIAAPPPNAPKVPRVRQAAAVNPAVIDIVLANGRSVRVGTDVDTTALVRIVAALEGKA